MKCPFCNAPMTEELLDYLVEIDDQEIKIEEVPTWVCETCDHTEVEEDVIEAVEDMLAHLDTVQAGAEEE
ncbi:MAG: YgiT-type zinc finger protein [Chloroflexi bacterium]|nr:YgiT-type zinc finger protein [Chloroflexota bacterium]